MMLKSLIVHIVPKRVTMMRTCLMLGKVTCQNCARYPAPSISAASYWSLGTVWRAARSETMKKGMVRHTLTMMMEVSAVPHPVSQRIFSSMMPKAMRVRLMTPKVSSYIQSQTRALNIEGIIHGKRMNPRKKFFM